jgi:Cof subfamily protein (haloacid dehalogenase superfamily)
LILVNGEAVSSTEIPLNTVESLADFNKNMKCHLSLYHGDQWFVPQYDKWAAREENNTKVKPGLMANQEVISEWKKDNKGAHKIMAMGDEAHIDAIKDYLSQNFPEQLHLYRSKPTYLEIANKEISKLTAIKFLLKNHYDLTPEQTIAFGDNYNDVEMIKGVGMGVAVGNARKEVLEVANIVTQSGTEDGVANSLKELFKIQLKDSNDSLRGV